MPRSSAIARAERRRRIAELHLRGQSQQAIAQKLALSQATVSRDLGEICREWRASAVRDFDLARGAVLGQLEQLEREAWAAWEASRAPRYAAQYVKTDGKSTERKSLVHREGDTRYLDTIHKCLIQKRALLGLDLQGPGAEPHDIPIDLGDSRAYVLAYFAQGILPGASHCGTTPARIGEAPGADQPGNVRPDDQPRTLEIGPAPGAARPDAGGGD